MSRRKRMSRQGCAAVSVAVCVVFCTPHRAIAQWVTFNNETATRINAPSSLVVTDNQEKDYAWGDFDHNGEVDLVIARKLPNSTDGPRVNVLLMNENGVLTDRTDEFASASDVVGDEGFNTPTNDRDIAVVDLNGDGWLDVVTAPACYNCNALPLHEAKPRVYMNLKDSPPGSGNWQGFLFEDFRIPQFTPRSNFSAIGYGDVTGDGFPDLYFVDYTNSLENRLLINDTTGRFSDETELRTYPALNNSSFGTHGIIEDINNDGFNDIFNCQSLGNYRPVIGYNDPDNEGFFDPSDFFVISVGSPYFIGTADLNNDNLTDLIVVTDGGDNYYLNQGNNANGHSIFLTLPLPNSGNIGGNITVGDLNNDGFEDIIVSDVDTDFTGCSRHIQIYRNNANPPNVSFAQDNANIPASLRQGGHDVAIFDINGDGALDLFVGRCNTTEVWIQEAPFGIDFSYPNNLPEFIPTETAVVIDVVLTPAGGDIDPGSAQIFVSTNGDPFAATQMESLGGNAYTAILPASGCMDELNYYFQATVGGATQFTDPPSAPASTYESTAIDGTEVSFENDVEGDVSQWRFITGVDVTGGVWEAADPNGTIAGASLAAPDEDAQSEPGTTMAFVTENGEPGGAAAASDVDGGPVILMTPPFNLIGSDAIIAYHQWFFCDDFGTSQADFLVVDISNDEGQNWTQVDVVDQTDGWEKAEFRVSDFIEPSMMMRVRWTTSDSPANSITEAGVDIFEVRKFVCEGVGCTFDAQCSDLVLCNGVETCDEATSVCEPGGDPCPGQICDPILDQCAGCLTDQDCQAPQVVEVQVGPDMIFSPADIVIDVGDTVHWEWAGGLHNVESGVDSVHDGIFRSGDPTDVVGFTFEVTFDQAFLDGNPMPGGVYPYYCIVHEALFDMIGSVTVVGSGCVETHCLDGACVSTPNDDLCVDATVCNGDETCNPATGECQAGTPLTCDDGVFCNGQETCDSVNGCQAGEPVENCCRGDEDCDDNNVCNGLETCVDNTCVLGTPPQCDDGNACNGDETCDPLGGCLPGEPLVCDDGDACNGDETCVPASGCQAGTPLECDDSNVCNGDETCLPASGCQAGTPLECLDENLCNGEETCDSVAGCLTGIPLVCDDGNVCTGDETCLPATGCQAGTPLECDDDNFCNGAEFCDTQFGCQAGVPVDCDDGVFCNGGEGCDPTEGCQLGGEACPNPDFPNCNEEEDVCEPLAQSCTTNLDCEDGDDCTTDVCNVDVCEFPARLYGDADNDATVNILDVICAARVIFQAATVCGDHTPASDEIDISPSASCGDDQLNIVDLVGHARAAFQGEVDECCQ